VEISLGKDWNTFYIDNDIYAASGKSYEISERIDRGGNAAVHECINNEGDVFAVKFQLSNGDRNIERFEQEIKALKEINHPQIIRYIDHGTVNLLNRKGEERSIMFLIMEKADSNLIAYMTNHEKIGYEIYAPQFRGLAEALKVLHQHAIHRDIKPENILVKGETWLLSDFGLCSYLDESEHQDITCVNEKVGPKFWLSPEAIDQRYFGEQEISTFSDVYQLCAVFWFVLTRHHPTGLLTLEQDELDPEIIGVISRSLMNDCHCRPQNGKELYDLMCKVTFDKE